jgi:hypothetical protein
MKTRNNQNTIAALGLRLAVGILLMGIILIQSCKGDDPIPATEQVKEVLKSGAWKMQTVTVDGTDQTTVYKNLTLTFSDTGFNTTNGGMAWPASGTWKFTDDTAKAIERSDGLTITIDEATTTKLVLRLTWSKTTIGLGRTASVKGVNVFTFGK